MPEQTVAVVGAAISAAGSVTTGGSVGAVEKTFDPRNLALTQDFVTMVGTKKEVMRVPIQRPPAQSFFSPHPDETWRIQVALIELKEERENYLVAPSLLDELHGEWVAKVLVSCQTRQGTYFLWPIRLPGPDGRIDTWNEAALQIAQSYGGRWIRLTPNKEAGAYEIIEPITLLAPPTWPDSPDALMTKAFRDRVISTVEHPVVKRLRGLG